MSHGTAASTQLPLLPIYDGNFLAQHAGKIVADPETAIVELVANAWDAGAGRVEITWPAEIGQRIGVRDNGSGMTREQLEKRWRTLYYNRTVDQGFQVEFPQKTRHRLRYAFGRNGVGRHAMFCFADNYTIETGRDGQITHAQVTRSAGNTPFSLVVTSSTPSENIGTHIHAIAERVALSADFVRELIGSRFVADPDFTIVVNGTPVKLTDLEHLCEQFSVPVNSLGKLAVLRFDSERTGRTSKQHGVAWWSRGRLVGTPSWNGIDGPYLDARTATAKRYTYVVQADMLFERVKADWSGFHANPDVNAALRTADEFIRDDLRAVTTDVRRERKRAALEENKTSLRQLPLISQEQIAKFAEELQIRCPTLGQKDLANAVEVFSRLEKARTGYEILERLTSLKPDDFDGLNSILAEWTVSDARKVLGELKYRLALIKRLEDILRRGHSDELHDLQPIFERGLWFFGPELESIAFESNRWMSTIVADFFKDAGTDRLTHPNHRPDFVVLPDATIGVYACDGFDDKHEVNGFSHVVVVELKRGGKTITFEEKDQAMKYCRQLRRVAGRTVPIVAYVLGEDVDPDAEAATVEGYTKVIARSYPVVLRQAHARTFHLLNKVELAQKQTPRDPDLLDILTGGSTLFDAV